MITLEIVIEPFKAIMQLMENGKKMGECKDLPLLCLRYGTSSITVPTEGKVYLTVELRVERTEPENTIKAIEATVTKSETKPSEYIPKITEVFKGEVQGKVSIEII